jgi:hypothetical protein
VSLEDRSHPPLFLYLVLFQTQSWRSKGFRST